jgi:predicted nucleotidyltransferase
MRAQEFITERKKRSKKSRGLGGYFFPGYSFYGGDAGEGGGDGGGGGESKQGMLEAMAADQVLDYVKRAHAPEAFDIEYSITDHPEWELKNIPLSQLNLDPDGEEPDPYNRVNWVDDDKVQELIPQIEAVLKRMPIVVDPRGWIIDGNHRAMAAGEAGLASVPALVPVKPGVTEGKVKLYTDPGYFGAEVDDAGFDSLPVVNISADRLVGFEPDSKMNQTKSRANVEKIVAGLKKGDKLPPLLVRKYKDGYQVLDGHHRFWAYKLLGVKSIPAQVVPDSDIEEISKPSVAEGKQPGKSVTDAIQKVLPIAQEIWFHGSRATGKHRRNSDTDILVVVPDDLVGDQYLGVVRTLQKLSSIFDNYDIQPTKSGTNIHRIAQEEGQLLWSNKQDMAENMDHRQDGGAVEELRTALLAKKDKLQAATDDQVYDIIDGIMTRIARSHSISGKKLHDMWVDKYRQIPDTWIMNENFADGRVKGKSRPGRVKRSGASCAGSVTDLRAKARKYGGERGKMYHWCANMKGGKK